MSFTLEICVGTLESAITAQLGSADRIELCQNLGEGGTTPSYGTIATANALLSLPIFPIIRPRGGNFIYTNEEFEAMKYDIQVCKDLGCEGIVLGILDKAGNVDTNRCAELIKLAGQMQLTFHRAFDHCLNMTLGLESIIELGFHRVLTSGGEEYAQQGISRLKSLVSQAAGRISIMPGAGIKSSNILEIARETGAREFHSTAKRRVDSAGIYPYETDPAEVSSLRRSLEMHVF